MKKAFFSIFFLLILLDVGVTNAQMVSSLGLGLRGTPDGGGLTGKFFYNPNWAIEAQLNWSGGAGFTDNDGPSMVTVGLLEYHLILPDPSWRIFLGPGLHAGTWNRYNNGYGYFDNSTQGVQGIFGLDAIAGVEYVFKAVPVGLSADIKPAVNLAGDNAFFANNLFGVSARYYVGRIMPRRRNQMQGQPSHS